MTALAQPTAPAQPPLLRRLSLHWATRFALTLALYILFVTLLDWPIFTLLGVPRTLAADLLTGVVDVLAAVAIVTLLVERRPLSEIGLGLRGMLPAWGWGFLLGAAYAAAAVALLALLGVYRVTAVNLALTPLLSAFVLHVVIGLFEEGLIRGILFRFLEEGLGSWVALVLSAAYFGAAHLSNPAATAWGAVAIAIEAGVLLGAAYMLTRSLWFVAGLHTAFNVVQGPVFGSTISGSALGGESLLVPTLQGPDLLTGGGFGIEASLVTVALGLALGIGCVALAVRRGRVMRPKLWRGGINRLGEPAARAER